MKPKSSIPRGSQIAIACVIIIYYLYFGILAAEYSRSRTLVYIANFILLACSLVVFRILVSKFSNSLWPSLIIVATLYLAYVLKLHILLYLLKYESSGDLDYINNAHKLELPLLNTPEIIDQYHIILCIVFLTVTSFLYLQSRLHKFGDSTSLFNTKNQGFINKKKIRITMLIAALLYLAVVVVVVNTGIALTSGDPDLVVKLPFRLAGIIQSILNFILPTVFALILYYSLLSQDPKVIRIAIIILLVFSVSATLITTSKAYIYIGFFSLFSMLIFYYGFSKKLALYLVIAIALFMLVSTIASVVRIVRVIEPGLGFSEIPRQAMEYWTYVNTDGLENKPVVYSNLGFVLRFNGADSLLNVISWKRSGGDVNLFDYIIMDYPRVVSEFFSVNVLGLSSSAGLSFSSSLLGFFYILFSSDIGLIFFLIAYFLLWNGTFYVMRKICAKDFILLLIPLLTTVVFFTSEGALETVYRSIFGLLLIAFAMRYGSRYYRN